MVVVRLGLFVVCRVHGCASRLGLFVVCKVHGCALRIEMFVQYVGCMGLHVGSQRPTSDMMIREPLTSFYHGSLTDLELTKYLDCWPASSTVSLSPSSQSWGYKHEHTQIFFYMGSGE